MRIVFIILLALASMTLQAADEDAQRFVAKRPSAGLLASPAPGAVILARLTPDEPVTVLVEQGGFVNVRTVSGMEGWLTTDDVTGELPADRQLAQLQSRIQELQGTVASLQRQLRSAQVQAQQANAALDNTQDSAQTEVARLQGELEVAQAEATSLRERNGALETSIAEYELAEESRKLLASNAAKAPQGPDWKSFGWPAIAGILLGLVLAGFIAGYVLKTRQIRARLYGMHI